MKIDQIIFQQLKTDLEIHATIIGRKKQAIEYSSCSRFAIKFENYYYYYYYCNYYCHFISPKYHKQIKKTVHIGFTKACSS